MSSTLRYTPASFGKTGSMSEIDRLRVENQRLSDEVKRLVTTESQLYEVQEHLDGQISAYRQLYELGKKFNTTVDLTTILQLAAQFVLYELNFERCLVLLKQPDANIFSIFPPRRWRSHHFMPALSGYCVCPIAAAAS
jgi:hypothetical protein